MKTLTKTDHNKDGYSHTNPSLREQTCGIVPPRLALINSKSDIVAVNDAWKSLAETTNADWSQIGPGANYLEVCRRASAAYNDAASAFAGINAVLRGRVPVFNMDYRCSTPSGWASFRMAVTPIDHGDVRACITHTDITALVLSNDKNIQLVKEFARRAINAQEQERERISQEIHDDLGNRMALLAFSAHHIIKNENSDSLRDARKEFFDQLTYLSNGLRDLSHTLHPPLLRHLGITGALITLRETFQKLHGIRMNLVMPAEMPRISEEVALCVFRVAQECLQNVAKHSGAGCVTVALSYSVGVVRLTVSDSGRGFVKSDAMKKSGIGLVGMESRAVSLGGTLIVNSAPGAGTDVQLTIPFRRAVQYVSTPHKEHR